MRVAAELLAEEAQLAVIGDGAYNGEAFEPALWDDALLQLLAMRRSNGSGSQTRMESVAEAVIALHRVCLALGVPHEVWVTPQALLIADLTSGERGKSLIAGLAPALCDYEDMGLALLAHVLPMRDAPQEIKLVLCLTDGSCNDAHLGKAVCRSLRGAVEVLGILLDPEESSRRYLADMLGGDRGIACRTEELPQKLGNVLRALRGI